MELSSFIRLLQQQDIDHTVKNGRLIIRTPYSIELNCKSLPENVTFDVDWRVILKDVTHLPKGTRFTRRVTLINFRDLRSIDDDVRRSLRVPLIKDIDTEILKNVERSQRAGGDGLRMSSWHTCQTTHCIAGWAIHLGKGQGYALENRFDSECAGFLIYAAAGKPAPNFYASAKDALRNLKRRAAREKKRQLKANQ